MTFWVGRDLQNVLLHRRIKLHIHLCTYVVPRFYIINSVKRYPIDFFIFANKCKRDTFFCNHHSSALPNADKTEK